MTLFFLAKWIHILSAAVLLGTGTGIAFFMVVAHRSSNVAAIAHVAGTVVIADMLFTATAVVIQPLSGLWLASLAGWPLTENWLVATYFLYLLVGACWIPVLFLQVRMRDLAREAANASTALPQQYHRLYRTWFVLGVPAFLAMLAIFWLMIAKPSL